MMSKKSIFQNLIFSILISILIFHILRMSLFKQRITRVGNNFLTYDNNDLDDERVLVFSTRRNLELPAASPIWFLDGAFQISKFYQNIIKIIRILF